MPPSIVATIALGICLAGLTQRISRWFRSDLGCEAGRLPIRHRLAAAGRALPGVVTSRRILRLPGILIRDVLFQGPLLRQAPLRWAAHMAMCYGFLLLVIVHALDDWTAPLLFADYTSTLDPFRWMRNLFAAMVLAGVLATVLRHRPRPQLQRFRSRADRLFILLLAVIVLSGVLLEGARIVSPAIFQEMVEDYMGDDDPEEVAALRHYWAEAFGAAPPPSGAEAADVNPETGPMAHAAYCADCHSRPRSAFLSYPLSRLMKPVAGMMDAWKIERGLWHIHFLASCLALACLPFSKFFHLLATPLNLLARAQGPAAAPALRPVRRALGMDACTHCGLCRDHCAVAPVYRVIPNPTILPSEKLFQVKAASQGKLPATAMAVLAEGSFICTLCGRCTQWCPSGIDLQDLWQVSRRNLIRAGFSPFDGRAALSATPRFESDQNPLHPGLSSLGLTDRLETFWACLQCTTCTSVCPVVAASDDAQQDLGLTPQQIMNLMRLGLKDEALGCRMLWDCVTCYKCQEHCPQNVKVADVLYELRNEAWRRRLIPRPTNTASGQGGDRRETPLPGISHAT